MLTQKIITLAGMIGTMGTRSPQLGATSAWSRAACPPNGSLLGLQALMSQHSGLWGLPRRLSLRSNMPCRNVSRDATNASGKRVHGSTRGSTAGVLGLREIFLIKLWHSTYTGPLWVSSRCLQTTGPIVARTRVSPSCGWSGIVAVNRAGSR